MKIYFKSYFTLAVSALFLAGCDHSTHDHSHDTSDATEHAEAHPEAVHLSEQQFKIMNIQTDTIPLRNISGYVEANGQLEVPPQNEATVTAVIGANVTSIKVIEGDKVKKWQPLAYISHPDLVKLQTDYLNSWNQLLFLEKEYERQKRLYEEKVGSGKDFQKTESELESMKAIVKGLEIQLKLLGLNLEKIRKIDLYEQVPVLSPIDGYVRLVEIKTGQYVQPETEMFEIVNNDHIHADLMVFEKDIHKVKKGQTILFTLESLPGKELEATIYSVGKAFEQNPKAIHLHAEIENKEGLLIPGMYVRGRILTEKTETMALPEEAVVREDDKYFIFKLKEVTGESDETRTFEPVEVITGARDNGWIEVKPVISLEKEAIVAWNNAYYLMAEMKKGEAEHSH